MTILSLQHPSSAPDGNRGDVLSLLVMCGAAEGDAAQRLFGSARHLTVCSMPADQLTVTPHRGCLGMPGISRRAACLQVG